MEESKSNLPEANKNEQPGIPVKVAKTAGFCFGVKRAMEKVYESLESGKKIYTLGPIIHNETVVKELEEKGVRVIDDEGGSLKKPEDCENALVIIRSHGVSRRVFEEISSWGVQVVDATCPFVLKIHGIVEKESSQGKRVVIIGNGSHPEVEGIKGWCVDAGQGPAAVIGDEEAALSYDPGPGYGGEEICVVSQTTFNVNKFKDFLEILNKKEYNIRAVNTICSATAERQREAAQLAAEMGRASGTMIVIGGLSSSNSRKLFEICSAECENTHFIQTLDDLNLELTKSIPCVGITAGASTPDKIIEEVQNYVRFNF